jgi:hypothetical protein
MPSSESDTRREEVREWVRKAMRSGNLSTEPERQPGSSEKETRRGRQFPYPKAFGEHEGNSGKKVDRVAKPVNDVESDAFFGEDEENSEESDEEDE